jgi:hypothetical protein
MRGSLLLPVRGLLSSEGLRALGSGAQDGWPLPPCLRVRAVATLERRCSASGACTNGHVGWAWALCSRHGDGALPLSHLRHAVTRRLSHPLTASAVALCVQVALLRRLGADSRAVDEYQCTPMQLAVVRGHADVVRALHAAGDQLEVVNEHGRTFVHYAAEFGHVRSLRAPRWRCLVQATPLASTTPVGVERFIDKSYRGEPGLAAIGMRAPTLSRLT